MNTYGDTRADICVFPITIMRRDGTLKSLSKPTGSAMSYPAVGREFILGILGIQCLGPFEKKACNWYIPTFAGHQPLSFRLPLIFNY